MRREIILSLAISAAALGAAAEDAPIIQDAEFYILQAQHAEQWAEDDAAVDQMLADFREQNDGKPPNILNILIDDVGFGDLGIPELNAIRGYETPNINQFSDEGMRMSRFYTEPSCTPTRVAQMTGRFPARQGMGDTAVDIAGFGLRGDEVILPEVLSEAGYATRHVGKWHMGDIEQSWPQNNGFDWAAFPIHQQGQLSIFNDDGIKEGVVVGNRDHDAKYMLDAFFRPDSSTMVTGVEAAKGEKAREVHMEAGERWTAKKYDEMNQRYQDQTIESLNVLAKGDKPFFLQYWPLLPLHNTRSTRDGYDSANGGLYVEKMQQLDAWMGEIFAELDKLGLAENTIVLFSGDNGHFTKYSPQSGFSAMIFRGGKADTTEGGIRVDAFIRWPGMIKADGIVNNMFHVSDMYQTLIRFAGATHLIPRDRIIDSIDQSASLLFADAGKGRRDSLIVYSDVVPEAIIKDQLKLKVPPKGENPIGAKFYNLYWDTREEYPISTEVGAWGGQEMVRVLGRHLARKQLYPDVEHATGIPYEGIENLRPETIKAVDAWKIKRAAVQK
ncbi:sulfatase-like hydrolase/transferase [Shimia sp.]|uniref:sulfatase-like hydrolase/transferase n=1 Tax=Shimia sp. TaxID=1954381 RepID=UPI0032982303